MKTLLNTCFIVFMASSAAYAGKKGSKFSTEEKKEEKQSPLVAKRAKLIDKKFKILSQKMKIYFIKNKIESSNERFSFFQLIAAVVRCLEWGGVNISSVPGAQAPYRAFQNAADSLDSSSYHGTHNTISNPLYGALSDKIHYPAFDAADQARKKGANNEGAQKVAYQEALLRMLDLLIENADIIIHQGYTYALNHFPTTHPAVAVPFKNGRVWIQFENEFFGQLPEEAHGFLYLLEVFDPISFEDQALAFAAGVNELRSKISVLTPEVANLILLDLLLLEEQTNTH